jgi:hypothetical protein
MDVLQKLISLDETFVARFCFWNNLYVQVLCQILKFILYIKNILDF